MLGKTCYKHNKKIGFSLINYTKMYVHGKYFQVVADSLKFGMVVEYHTDTSKLSCILVLHTF